MADPSFMLETFHVTGRDNRNKIQDGSFDFYFGTPIRERYLQAHLEKLLNEKPDERAENGAVFDRDTYLKDTEGFDDVEVNAQ